MNFCVITTINNPTKAIEILHEKFGKNLIVVGDKKTPENWGYADVTYLNPQIEEGWYEVYAPYNHYARKNLGYLEAMRSGAELIYDTDDDNIPNEEWGIRDCITNANGGTTNGWFNAYQMVGNCNIWPRGFSLKSLFKIIGCSQEIKERTSSIQQGLANGEPDVDAIFRLVIKKENKFSTKRSIFLEKNTWCPFNSQSTWWFPDAYPLMYLPIYATFRMTDIWRSFVAQRCLWEIGEGVTFHSPSEVFQDRNEHDLMKDFKDEVPGYLRNDEIVEILSALTLKQGKESICNNMLTCYQAIVDENILPEMEIRTLKAWINDYENITRNI